MIELIINFFKREWSICLENNDLPGISACALWEAGKAVMRGKIISFSSNRKNKESSGISELELRIKSLEVVYSASQEELNELRKTKLELN